MHIFKVQTLYDIRGNVTEQWEKANGPVKRYYEDLICLTRSNRLTRIFKSRTQSSSREIEIL